MLNITQDDPTCHLELTEKSSTPKEQGALSVYDAGFISLDKQFLSIGINGMAEAAEFTNITVGNNEEYKNFVSKQLKVIYQANQNAKK
jgi:ribonucleoside-triphosphate reductase